MCFDVGRVPPLDCLWHLPSTRSKQLCDYAFLPQAECFEEYGGATRFVDVGGYAQAAT